MHDNPGVDVAGVADMAGAGVVGVARVAGVTGNLLVPLQRMIMMKDIR